MIKIGENSYTECKILVDSKIRFTNEKQAYMVQASNYFFSVCTKPFNARKTVLYTIIDWRGQIRGPENLIFGLGAETRKQCEEMLERIIQGESEVSERHRCKLDIEKITFPKQK